MDSKQDQALVTIIIPSFNHAPYVQQAIRSVLSQTYNNIELIVIDDGSTDNSREEIARTLTEVQSIPRLVVYIENENKGLCKTLNEGIHRASGDYIGFLASDDAYLPKKLEHCVRLLERSESAVGAIYTDGYLVNHDGERIGRFTERYPVPLLTDAYKELLVGNWIPALGVLYKKSVFSSLGGFNESLRVEDYEFLIRLTKKYRILRLSECHFLYRIHEGSTSANTALMRSEARKVAKLVPDLNRFISFREALAARNIWAARRELTVRNVELSCRFLLRKYQSIKRVQDVGPLDIARHLVSKVWCKFQSKIRIAFYKTAGVNIPWNCELRGSLTIFGNGRNITFGNECSVLGGVRLVSEQSGGRSTITLGDKVTLDSGAEINALGGSVVLSDGVFLGSNAILQGRGGLTVGENTMIAPLSAIFSTNHVTRHEIQKPFVRQGYRSQGVVIGDNCWIGSASVVLDGTNMEEGTVVGANCVVRGQIAKHSLIAAKGVLGRAVGAAADSVDLARHRG